LGVTVVIVLVLTLAAGGQGLLPIFNNRAGVNSGRTESGAAGQTSDKNTVNEPKTTNATASPGADSETPRQNGTSGAGQPGQAFVRNDETTATRQGWQPAPSRGVAEMTTSGKYSAVSGNAEHISDEDIIDDPGTGIGRLTTRGVMQATEATAGGGSTSAVNSVQTAGGGQTTAASQAGAQTTAASQADAQTTAASQASGQTTAQTSAGTGAQATTTAAAATTPATAVNSSAALDADVLNGKIICLDPGHQRRQNNDLEQVAPGSSVKKPKVSSGTAGIATGEFEYVLNLAVALKLRDQLEARGAKVVMTRTEHDVDVSNIERAVIGNDAKADLVIRIHADGSTNRETNGISMLIPSSAHIGNELAATSKAAGQAALDAVIKETGARNRGLSVRDDMTGFNWSKVPVILIEMGFMSNAAEDRLMATDEYRAKLATGLFNGCVAFFTE